MLGSLKICANVVVQSLNCVQLFATPWTPACQASQAFTISQSLLKLMSTLPQVFPSVKWRRGPSRG